MTLGAPRGAASARRGRCGDLRALPAANASLSAHPGNGPRRPDGFRSRAAPEHRAPRPGAALPVSGGNPNVIVRSGRRRARALGDVARLVLPQPTLGRPAGLRAAVYESERPLLHSDERRSRLPITAATRAVAAAAENVLLQRRHGRGDAPCAMLTERRAARTVPMAGAQAASRRPYESTLSHLRLVLAIVCLRRDRARRGARVCSSRARRCVPVRRLTGAAERVARTQDLGHRITRRASRTSSGACRRASTRCWPRSSARGWPSASSSPTPRTSCARRSPASRRTSTRSRSASACPRASARASSPPRRPSCASSPCSWATSSTSPRPRSSEIELEDVRLDLAAAGAVERARLHAPAVPVRAHRRALPRARRARAGSTARSRTCSTTPSSGAPRTGPSRCACGDGAARACATTDPGSTREDLPRVFDRFYRAPAARSRPGSGLGLAIVRQMAEAHGGAVHAANDPGGGRPSDARARAAPDERRRARRDAGRVGRKLAASGSLLGPL